MQHQGNSISVCLSMIVKQRRGGLSPLELSDHEMKIAKYKHIIIA